VIGKYPAQQLYTAVARHISYEYFNRLQNSKIKTSQIFSPANVNILAWLKTFDQYLCSINKIMFINCIVYYCEMFCTKDLLHF